METCHQDSEEQFASMEAQLARLGIRLQGLLVQSLQAQQIRLQPILWLEQGAATAVPLLPAVQLPSRHVYNISQLPACQEPQCNHLEMITGKSPLPEQYRVDMKDLDARILQMHNDFTITQTQNE